ncbi:hypothetical protein KIN20_010832 [Parelaphostrongylus tenuis]|uniref:Uncharacterized protein n=1 Tax=Parelaphostrongylus tenuis TaxID=148309 RepID=A0AAD5M8H1_PARTN|nr:hypothetical protein KIN20_010832 [Parelaphostrongylus tenuis]
MDTTTTDMRSDQVPNDLIKPCAHFETNYSNIRSANVQGVVMFEAISSPRYFNRLRLFLIHLTLIVCLLYSFLK